MNRRLRSMFHLKMPVWAAAVGCLLPAAQACGRSDAARSEDLITFMQEKQPDIRWGAIEALALIEHPSPKAVAALKAVFFNDEERNLRALALQTIRSLGVVDTDVLQAAIDYAVDSDDYLGHTAFDLCRARGDEFIKQLQTTAEKTPDEATRQKYLTLAKLLQE